MIDRHYGHVGHDSREHAVSLVEALAIERAVDAVWTPPPSGRWGLYLGACWAVAVEKRAACRTA